MKQIIKNRYQIIVMAALAIVFSLYITSPAEAATYNVTCSGDITSALNSAIASSVSGDTINISAGSCAITGSSGFSDKNIWIKGAGKTNTVITADGSWTWTIESTGSNNPQWHLSGFTMQSSTRTGVLIIVYANQHASWRGPFHINDVKLDFPAGYADGMINFNGPIYGVIDHFDCIQYAEACLAFGGWLGTETGSSITNLGGAFMATLPFRPGASDYLYVEDSTFTGISPTGVAAYDLLYTGSRLVWRHNTMTDAPLFGHGSWGTSINTAYVEIYNNVFNWTKGPGGSPGNHAGGGTVLFYNNTISVDHTSYAFTLGETRLEGAPRDYPPLRLCDGTHNWDGNAGDAQAPGWPCLSQIGRAAGKSIAAIQSGDKQASFPAYMWNNGPQAKCSNPSASGADCDNSLSFSVGGGQGNWIKGTAHSTGGFGNGDVDYFKSASKPIGAGTHTLNYTPYTYPHPLASGSVSPIIGDINLDHIVNSIDYSILNSDWFTSNSRSDLNHDGLVNAIDYSLLNANWFRTW
jgi:hypothetical protein